MNATHSALQQAHDAQVAADEPEAPAPIVCTVAGPRLPFSPDSYSGAELQATCPRPGAYNAFALPSLFNGARRTPPQAAFASNAVHTSGRTKPAYLPRAGSIPALLLAHLQAHGGHMTYSEVARRFGMPPSSTTAVFKKTLEEGLLLRIVAEGRAAFALPGYVPPPAPPRPSKEFLSRQAKLKKRLAEVALLQQELRDLQAPETAQAPASHQPSMS